VPPPDPRKRPSRASAAEPGAAPLQTGRGGDSSRALRRHATQTPRAGPTGPPYCALARSAAYRSYRTLSLPTHTPKHLHLHTPVGVQALGCPDPAHTIHTVPTGCTPNSHLHAGIAHRARAGGKRKVTVRGPLGEVCKRCRRRAISATVDRKREIPHPSTRKILTGTRDDTHT